MNKTLYRQFTPSSRPRKRRRDADKLTTGAAITFMGFVLLAVATIFYADAYVYGYTGSLITGACGKWFIGMLIIGAIDIIFGAAVIASGRKMPETDDTDTEVERVTKQCERKWA